jgi:hypothetical protein
VAHVVADNSPPSSEDSDCQSSDSSHSSSLCSEVSSEIADVDAGSSGVDMLLLFAQDQVTCRLGRVVVFYCASHA